MCLAVPGQIVEIDHIGDRRQGLVDFRKNQIQVDLSLVPEAQLGTWVLVHAGFALECLDEEEALETWDWLQEAGVLS